MSKHVTLSAHWISTIDNVFVYFNHSLQPFNRTVHAGRMLMEMPSDRNENKGLISAMKKILPLLLLFSVSAANADSHELTVEIWVDNWFEMHVNGEKVIEDSVSITTERSFNAETGSFITDTPAVVAIMAKDFKENDTGLEYIGSNRQQMGDGGMIFQIKDTATGDTVAVSDKNMRCLVVHRAPVDTSCAKESNPTEGQGACASETTDVPADWTAASFDDSAWPAATEHSEREVRPKDGYDEISWDSKAMLIWSNDLVQDNTLLCRLVIE